MATLNITWMMLLIISIISESYQLPLELPVGTQLKGVILCQSPTEMEQKTTHCWFLRPNRNYDMYLQNHALSDNDKIDHDHSRTNIDEHENESLKDPESVPLARFNVHLYLDHMWHLNIGFTR